MAQADLAIGAGGATSWERACLGLPSLIITMAENQRPVAEGLDRKGIAKWLGDQGQVTGELLERTLRELLNHSLDKSWSALCFDTVDGKGTERVCAVLTVSPSTQLRSRRVTPKDEALLLEWANDSTTRKNAFSSGLITTDEHRSWLQDRLSCIDSCRFFIVETLGQIPIGQVRFDLNGGEWEIDYSLAPQFRRRKLGKSLIEAALDGLRLEVLVASLLGRVKSSNLPSRRVFESLGFRKQQDDLGFVFRRAL
jgi:RimJ/RimL family protein N-acetyltransferase